MGLNLSDSPSISGLSTHWNQTTCHVKNNGTNLFQHKFARLTSHSNPELQAEPSARSLKESGTSSFSGKMIKDDIIRVKSAQSGLDAFIQKAANTYKLDPNLIASIINTQSDFNPNAVSPAGAQGLMQLMPATAAELGVTNAFDPEQNIMGASRYLKNLISRYNGNLGMALTAYNWGMGNLDRKPESVPAETVHFVSKVLARVPQMSVQQGTNNPSVKLSDSSTTSEIPEQTIRNQTIRAKTSQNGIGAIIQKAAKAYDLDPNLIGSVINAESDFNPNAASPAGAQGLMQLMPATAAELGVINAFDPEQNIMGASRYLKGLIHRYDGDLHLALTAYNWGMGNVERNLDKVPRETTSFVWKVMSHLG